jgi:hypothetical protein
VAASKYLDPKTPTPDQFVKGLYEFKGQDWTKLGGLVAPLTYNQGGLPTVPYCGWAVISNADNSGWNPPVEKMTCSDITASGPK